jgi:hypothetical protein
MRLQVRLQKLCCKSSRYFQHGYTNSWLIISKDELTKNSLFLAVAHNGDSIQQMSRVSAAIINKQLCVIPNMRSRDVLIVVKNRVMSDSPSCVQPAADLLPLLW